MLPTRAQVKAQFLALLNDPNQAVYTDAVFTQAINEGFDALFNGLLQAQAPAIQIISTYTLPANTLSLTPAMAGISSLADYDKLEERTTGSSDNYTEVYPVDTLSQRSATDRLLEFVWRNSTFYFVGATTSRDLRITYQSSGEAPGNDNDVINLDGCKSFLAKASVAAAGPRKGDDEIADRCRIQAYGARYDEGVIGGELYRIIQPRVRSMQNVQVAPRMYGSHWARRRRAVPYVAAQAFAGTGDMPQQFSSATGSITGTINGVNATFFLSLPLSAAAIYRNGILMTQPDDVSFSVNVITFTGFQIPQSGDIITALGWL